MKSVRTKPSCHIRGPRTTGFPACAGTTVLREPEYVSAQAVRRVRHNGEIRWQGGTVYIVGVVVVGHISHNNDDPHPARLRFAPGGRPSPQGGGYERVCTGGVSRADPCVAASATQTRGVRRPARCRPENRVSGDAALPLFTMSNSPVPDVPATTLSFFRTAILVEPQLSRSRGACGAPGYPSSCCHPRGDGGAPTGAILVSCRAGRARRAPCESALPRYREAASRRSAVAVLGRGPLPFPALLPEPSRSLAAGSSCPGGGPDLP